MANNNTENSDSTSADVSEANASLLEQIITPEQLRELSPHQLPALADELRHFLLDSVSKTGGHLSSGLGAIELTIALHYVFNTPSDRLVWDVGHQSYPHKILTGRREQMDTIRKRNGLSGFPKRTESAYDAFGVGHSSTSISAALGMAVAAQHANSDRKSVAIIGDGAMTAGIAFEALNHAGHLNTNLLVILNDNEMSISPNVGGLSNYLAKVLSGKFYSSMREGGKKVFKNMPAVSELARRTEEHMKGMVVPGTLFEELGFNYIGPVDGHDLDTLVTTLQNIKSLSGPQFLHIVTKKGKGYQHAEDDPCKFHGMTPFDRESGKKTVTASSKKSYTDIFGEWLCDTATQDQRLIAITPAMCEGSGMVKFSQQFSKRYIDVGIAEQHAITLAAGLACEGLKPVVAIYSSFLQRGYDQLLHDVAIQNLPVLFAVDRAGIVGPDGPTHAGCYDISFLRCVPNLSIMTPADEQECRALLSTGYQMDTPAVVRYPRGSGPGIETTNNLTPLPFGKGEIRRQGKRIAILNFGPLLQEALHAAEQLDATVANMRFVKPMDEALLHQLAEQHDTLITLEDNATIGGAGSGVNEWLAAQNIQRQVINLGLPDHYIEHGTREELLSSCGLDAQGIINSLS
ncbi:MAG: 1-deoxy-D-xylulose-5-phosphate synthase [Gammaproteobacteria bacterium]|nr:1-deoxy-D-xylulose-5-phosphate synthase [Gammaproteobacteria bacterium]MCF6230511.1 1-deoxy-D-xylulose-5-phosphate synthase [Gammaproteobacteria bacterium]